MLELEYEFREKDLVHFNEQRLASNVDMQKKIRQSSMLVPGVMLVFGRIHTLTIEPEFLLEKSPGGKHKTLWKEMLRVERHKDYIYLYVAIDAAIVIPRETVTKGDLKAFAKHAESLIDRLADA
ncbi:MAG: YcxB family protein [Methylococcaceae bacterium]|nr:YcxB family protein [Methylococcaceae bacterium]